MLAQTEPVQGLNRQTSGRRCSGPTAQTPRWGSHRGSTPVQSSAKPEGLLLGVCMCVSVCVGVIEKHGFPQRDPPLIVK